MAGNSGDNGSKPLPDAPEAASFAQLSGPLDRIVADAYTDVLGEPVPQRLLDLLEAIRRLEAGQKKPG